MPPTEIPQNHDEPMTIARLRQIAPAILKEVQEKPFPIEGSIPGTINLGTFLGTELDLDEDRNGQF